jgi:hypothetical protein
MAVTNYYTVNGEILGEHTLCRRRLKSAPFLSRLPFEKCTT